MVYYEGFEHDKNGWAYAQTPNLGTGWVEGSKMFTENSYQFFATQGAAKSGDVVLQSSTAVNKNISGQGAGEADRFIKRGTVGTIVDEGTYAPPAGYKYGGYTEMNSGSQVDPLLNPWGFDPKRISVDNGRISISQPAVKATLYRTTTGRTYDGDSKKAETRLRLRYYRKVEKNIKKFKFFGVTIKTKKL